MESTSICLARRRRLLLNWASRLGFEGAVPCFTSCKTALNRGKYSQPQEGGKGSYATLKNIEREETKESLGASLLWFAFLVAKMVCAGLAERCEPHVPEDLQIMNVPTAEEPASWKD